MLLRCIAFWLGTDASGCGRWCVVRFCVTKRRGRENCSIWICDCLPDLNNPRPEYEFAAIDDYSREAVAQITADRTSRVATDFLEQVLAQLPYRVEAVMTDNDLVFTMRFAFHSDRQTRFQQACRSLGIQHRLIRPHTPASNGKVERFIKTIDDECYAVHRPRSSQTRRRVLQHFLWHYNHERRHLSLGGLTPVQRREAYFAQAQVSQMS